MKVVLIHYHPYLMEECCELINKEWPRSHTARMRTLQMSCDTLPSSLALVDENKVLGHSKVSAITSIPRACFVECVVIHPDYRGKGLGKLIMLQTEKYAASQGMDTAYLSTIDQQEFYRKIGYTKCDPISIYGCCTHEDNNSTKSHPYSEKITSAQKKDIFDSMNKSVQTTDSDLKNCPLALPQNVPPPPPLPEIQPLEVENKTYGNQRTFLIPKTYFKKKIGTHM